MAKKKISKIKDIKYMQNIKINNKTIENQNQVEYQSKRQK